jgi:hypothetical protein
MRRWRNLLALAAGILGGLGGPAPCATAQFSPPGAFAPLPNGNVEAPPGAGGGPFGGDSGVLAPADFPNPAVPSQDPVSPFSLKPGGMQNAFSRGNVPAVASNGFTDSSEPARTPLTSLAPLFGPVSGSLDLFARVEYLNWHVSSGPLAVPLVTTTNNLSVGNTGELGNPTTVPLLNSGNAVIDYRDMSGVRLTTGISFFEVSGFWFSQRTTAYTAGSLSNPTQFLAIPYQETNPLTSFANAFPLNFPPNSFLGFTLGGTIAVTSQLTFWGTDANVFLPIIDDEPWKLEVFAGFRYLRMDETLTINTVRGPFNPGSLVFFQSSIGPTAGQFNTTTNDSFGTTNAFNGGQVGLRGILKFGVWSLSGDAKIAMGATTERLNISGTSSLVTQGSNTTVQTAPGGIFALPSNSGVFANNKFAYVPEANLTLSCQCFDFLRLFAGYNFLYWSQVTRPGDAVNNNIDSRQVPTTTTGTYATGVTYLGPGTPALIQRSFIAQGFFAGLELKF